MTQITILWQMTASMLFQLKGYDANEKSLTLLLE